MCFTSAYLPAFTTFTNTKLFSTPLLYSALTQHDLCGGAGTDNGASTKSVNKKFRKVTFDTAAAASGENTTSASGGEGPPLISFKHKTACPLHVFQSHLDTEIMDECWWLAFALVHGKSIVEEGVPRGALVYLDSKGKKQTVRLYKLIESCVKSDYVRDWFTSDTVKAYCKAERLDDQQEGHQV